MRVETQVKTGGTLSSPGFFQKAAGCAKYLGVLLCCSCLLLVSLVFSFPVAADFTLPPGTDDSQLVYVVDPGDTLQEIAQRSGISVHILMALNDLQSPAHIYPGQVLELDSTWMAAQYPLVEVNMPAGQKLLDLSHRAGVSWEYLAAANRVLNPAELVTGYALSVPYSAIERIEIQSGMDSPTAAALLYRQSLWVILQLNPYPVHSGESLVLPESLEMLQKTGLPEPVNALQVSSQPLIRGSTAEFILTASAPVTGWLSALDQQVFFYPESRDLLSEIRYLALLGLSPLLEPGAYTATVSLQVSAEEVLAIDLPLRVAAGRYDYERIDLPPDRQSLLDPALSQLESEKIEVLRSLQSPDRYWSRPFAMPFPGSVTSYYGSRRSYGYGFTSYHAGTDFRAEVGDPVLAPAPGTVVLAERLVVRGNAVMIDHGWGVLSGYWHLSRIDVEVGQIVQQGDMVGAVGNTGLSTGPHLHWEMWVNGIPVSPLEWTTTSNLN
jgi:murein DD-endopeptidase MepM/ murein hydrolase activator NlpD